MSRGRSPGEPCRRQRYGDEQDDGCRQAALRPPRATGPQLAMLPDDDQVPGGTLAGQHGAEDEGEGAVPAGVNAGAQSVVAAGPAGELEQENREHAEEEDVERGEQGGGRAVMEGAEDGRRHESADG